MKRYEDFTNNELYIMNRAFMDSSFKFFMKDGYEPEQKAMHSKLLNEIVDEIKERIYVKRNQNPNL